MSYTEIPDHLLDDVAKLVHRIERESDKADGEDFTLKFDEDSVAQLWPLLKWLEYADAMTCADIDAATA